jgi:small subunit ribosomal protein S6
MRAYEMMAIIHPDLDSDTHEKALKKIEKLIEDNQGKIDSVNHWGKKKLAYEINHLKDGSYSIFNFSGAPETIAEVDRVLKISDEVVRFMIVRRPDREH